MTHTAAAALCGKAFWCPACNAPRTCLLDEDHASDHDEER